MSTEVQPVQRSDDLLQQYLAARNEPCPSCGYELRGLTGEACPECGQRLRLRVGLETPNLAAFVSGLVAIACALGFSALVSAMGILMLIEAGPDIMDTAPFLLFGVETALAVPLLVLWIKSSGWIRRQPTWKRRLLAGLCWMMPIAFLGATWLWEVF